MSQSIWLVLCDNAEKKITGQIHSGRYFSDEQNADDEVFSMSMITKGTAWKFYSVEYVRKI